MNFRKKLILNSVLTFALAVLCILTGRESPLLFGMGIATAAVGTISSIRLAYVLSSHTRFCAYRQKCLAAKSSYAVQKSYSAAMRISVWAEFCAMYILLYLGCSISAVVLSYVICGQMLIYSLLLIIYSHILKKFSDK